MLLIVGLIMMIVGLALVIIGVAIIVVRERTGYVDFERRLERLDKRLRRSA